MILHIKVKPGSKANRLLKDSEGKWVLKIAAPPAEGKANDAVIRFLSSVLKMPKSSVQIIGGQTSSYKKIYIVTEYENLVLQMLQDEVNDSTER